MTFEQLMAKAAEEANENELVTLTVAEARAHLDGKEIDDLDNAMDHAQGAVHSGQAKVSWILIKIVQ